MPQNKIPIIMCIDLEPDPTHPSPDHPEPWVGTEGAFEFFREIRPKVARQTGSPPHFNWFIRFDPQIEKTYGSWDWVPKTYGKELAECEKAGDEMALHPHAYRWIDEKHDWLIDHGNQDWVNYCTEGSFKSFKESFGYDCKSFRFGERFMNAQTMNLIEKLGARYDMTLEPDHESIPTYHPEKPYTGRIPETFGMPHHPFRPLKTDFRKPDDSKKEGLWVIPISTGKAIYRDFNAFDKFWRRFLIPNSVKPINFTLHTWIKPRHFSEVADDLIETLERPYLAMSLRVDLFATPNRNIVKHFDFLLNHPRRHDFVFSTPEEAMKIMGYA